MALNAFLTCPELDGRQKQVISLGCGFDPTAFQLLSDPALRDQFALYIDVDFGDLTTRKRSMILNAAELCDLICLDANAANPTAPKNALHTEKYHLLPCDLTQMDQLERLLTAIEGFSFEHPTLLISECVLTYVPTKQSDFILSSLANRFENVTLIIYEQIHPGTRLLLYID